MGVVDMFGQILELPFEKVFWPPGSGFLNVRKEYFNGKKKCFDKMPTSDKYKHHLLVYLLHLSNFGMDNCAK